MKKKYKKTLQTMDLLEDLKMSLLNFNCHALHNS